MEKLAYPVGCKNVLIPKHGTFLQKLHLEIHSVFCFSV